MFEALKDFGFFVVTSLKTRIMTNKDDLEKKLQVLISDESDVQ